MQRCKSFERKCFVPTCLNTGTNSRDKLFICVKECLQEKWCRQVGIPYNPERRMYVCEDHLNLKEDVRFYSFWTSKRVQPRLKHTAILRNTSSGLSNSKEYEVQQQQENVCVPQQDHSSLLRELLQSCENLPPRKKHVMSKPCLSSISTHTFEVKKVHASTQCVVKMKNKSTSVDHSLLTTSENKDSSTPTCTSPSIYVCPSETDASVVPSKKNPTGGEESRKPMLDLIYKKPKMYMGLPKMYLWILDYIVVESKSSITTLSIIIILYKIRNNLTINMISDLLHVSKSAIIRMLDKDIEILASFFQNLIYFPTRTQIKRNLPLVFKIRFANVTCILDAFELEIEKPSNPLHQAQTWSQYKSCNTIKYIVACTPNGLICYVSKGYGGRISDKALVENSDFIESLPSNCVIMADRGFKEIDSLLITKGIKLLRPPSVYSSTKPSKQDVLQTKVIASLRVHIERVIRRIREFKILKPHSVVNNRHIKYLDCFVIIACALINLQSEIIKRD